MKSSMLAVAMMAALTVALPAALDSQKPLPGTRGEQRDRDRDNRDVWDVILGRGQADRGQKAGSPAFCRSGAGHPVHGRRWCTDKGFGLGSAGRYDRDLSDIILRRPRQERTRMDRGGLIDILGDVVVGRFEARSRELGSPAPLTGSWAGGADGGRILHIESNGLRIAEIVADTAGRVAEVRLRRER
jgi:hypothetical protein